MNQQALLRKVKQMQDEMLKTQKEINETVFSATTGGIVTVEMYGNKQLNRVRIREDFEAESKEDFEMLEDMIVAACNQTYIEIEKYTKEKMGKYQALLGGMGSMF